MDTADRLRASQRAYTPVSELLTGSAGFHEITQDVLTGLTRLVADQSDEHEQMMENIQIHTRYY